ncbi:Hint domain-containing protein [Rhodobacter aestuarii]|nr:Hint domain-containing protein [Rhodobacter aestuarii]
MGVESMLERLTRHNSFFDFVGVRKADRRENRKMREACLTCRSGLYSGVEILTPKGEVAVEFLRVGDFVKTFDHGFQRITRIKQYAPASLKVDLPEKFWPVCLPQGFFDNRHDVLVASDQYVQIESSAAEIAYGDPHVSIPARAGLIFPEITQVAPPEDKQLFRIFCERDELLETGYGWQYLARGSIYLGNSFIFCEEENNMPLSYTKMPYQDAVDLVKADVEIMGGLEPYREALTRLCVAHH